MKSFSSFETAILNAGTALAGMTLAATVLSVGMITVGPFAPVAAQAGVVTFDYNGGLSGSTSNLRLPTWEGDSLADATAIDLHGNQWNLSNEADPNDTGIGGFSLSTPIELTSSGLALTPEVITWNDGFVLGANNATNDMFTMTLTTITSTTPHGSGGGSSINVDFSGSVSDSLGLFKDDAATFDLFALDTFTGNNRIGEFNFTAASDGVSLAPPIISGGGGPAITDVPESPVWLSMLIGFAGVGFLSYRKARSNRLAVNI